MINKNDYISPLLVLMDKIKASFRAQGMPKWQNIYLGKGDGEMRIKGGGGIVVLKNCYYEPRLGCYMYWVEVGGVGVTVPECNLIEIQKIKEYNLKKCDINQY